MAFRMVLACAALAIVAPASAKTLDLVASPPADLAPLAMSVIGRVAPGSDTMLIRQWPGTYFETAFRGPAVFLRVGAGAVSLRVRLDGGTVMPLIKPAEGLYRLSGLGSGVHALRVDVASESQAAPTGFGGFFAPGGTQAAPLVHRKRAIEFIGDSHTVGYGNTATQRKCSADEVWAATDTSRGIAPLMAGHYDADYEVNAISGRGIVRNYNGINADTLPQAYPFALFDKARPADTTRWHPQVIVIALGTNDFSTKLNPGEKWQSRDQLRTDYEDTFVRFVQQLRVGAPHAVILLWSTDFGDGEIRTEVGKVADRLRLGGDTRVGFVPVHGLAFSACDYHPGSDDDRKIAKTLTTYLDAYPGVWGPR